MTKLEIFDDVVDIMRKDSATIKDKQGGDAVAYRARVFEDMDEMDFLFLMKSYLATFGLTVHLGFYKKEDDHRLTFGVQPYQGQLYVVAVAENSAIHIGDCTRNFYLGKARKGSGPIGPSYSPFPMRLPYCQFPVRKRRFCP